MSFHSANSIEVFDKYPKIMKEMICKGKTKNGFPCKNKAIENGFCNVHNPIVLENKLNQKEKQNRLDEVLNLIYSVCTNKGWSCHLGNKDTQTFKYATIEVSKYFPKENNDEKVTGIIDIDVHPEKGLKFQAHKTSFYGYGISALASSLEGALKELPWLSDGVKEKPKENERNFELIESLLNRFDRVVRQLKRRYNNRSTVEVKDEYDVQDVLHSVLKCYFDDLRPEDYTPSYAGSCSRVDFLLKKEKIIIEVKYATDKLRDKKIGEQLIIDIKRYEVHPDCETLFCFVYDPEGNIRNPIALENDLSGKHGKNNLKVKVIISPK